MMCYRKNRGSAADDYETVDKSKEQPHYDVIQMEQNHDGGISHHYECLDTDAAET